MNFRPSSQDEPEINLIPFIDVLLVVLIFLMLSTTYSKFTELQVNLPTADAQSLKTKPREVIVSISNDGRTAVDKTLLADSGVEAISRALRTAAQANADAVVVISADAAATHQSVINVMDAARRANLVQITFATQQTAGGQPAARRP